MQRTYSLFTSSSSHSFVKLHITKEVSSSVLGLPIPPTSYFVATVVRFNWRPGNDAPITGDKGPVGRNISPYSLALPPVFRVIHRCLLGSGLDATGTARLAELPLSRRRRGSYEIQFVAESSSGPPNGWS